MISKNQIKEIRSLQLKKFRDSQSRFIAEGVKTVEEIVSNRPELVKQMFATREFIKNHKEVLASLPFSCTEISAAELERISLQSSPNQALAVCSYLPKPVESFDFEKNFSLYLDDVRDPGNFGTIVRLADWFGISTIFCSPASCDLYNPKVIQSAMGAFLRVNIIYTELTALKQSQNIRNIYGAVLNGDNLYRQTLQNGLIVVGNEANGIHENNLPHITQAITIPAHRSSGTESLNAAVATSIIVSEFFRQLKQV